MSMLSALTKTSYAEKMGIDPDKIYMVEDPVLKDFDPISYKKVVSDAVKKYGPFMPASTPPIRTPSCRCAWIKSKRRRKANLSDVRESRSGDCL